jgi:hypothetical protein
MKKQIVLMFFLFLFGYQVNAAKSFEMELLNLVQLSENVFTFDVRMRNTGTDPSGADAFAVEGIQWQFTFNNAMMNGGGLRNAFLTYVSGTTDLVGVKIIPTTANFTSNQVVLNWITNPLNLDEETTLFDDGNWKRIGTFSVKLSTAPNGTTLHNFADVALNMQFSSVYPLLTECNYYVDAGVCYRADANFQEITSKTKTNSISPTQQLASHYLGGGTDWATSANWNNAVASNHASYHQIPGSTQNALIGVNAIIAPTTQASVKNLYLKTGASLNIQSNASGTGSLIHSNTGVPATVQRYLPGAVNAWHMISAPVNNMAFTGSDWSPSADEDLYTWLENSPGTWINYKNTTTPPTFLTVNGSDNFSIGRGYIADYNSANPIHSYNGALNAGAININLEKNAAKSWTWTTGWNLIGNPYASSLNFTQLLADNVGDLAEAYAQIYNPNKAGGAGYEQVTTIAPGQGFFVVANTDGAVLNISTNQQVHGGSFMKEGNITDALHLRLSNGDRYDETQLFLKQGATSTHDFYDATKMFSFEVNQPQLYTLTDGSWPLAIQSLGEIAQNSSVPLSLSIPYDGNYTINITTKDGAFAQQAIGLRDLVTGLDHQLSENAYTFNASKTDPSERFEIVFGVVGQRELVKANVRAVVSDNGIQLTNLPAQASVRLFDAMGKTIYNTDGLEAGQHTLSIKLPSGVYILHVAGNKTVDTLKLIVK